MNTIEQREVNTQRTTTDANGGFVQEKTRSVGVEASPKSTAINAIWFVYGFIAVLLGLRFILKLTGANSGAGFVSFVYAVSGFLSRPFDAIFGVSSARTETITSVFEPSILVAIVVYGLIAWGLVKLITINRPNETV